VDYKLPEGFPVGAKEVLESLLRKNPVERLVGKELKELPWFKSTE